jgi:hypothetical protein
MPARPRSSARGATTSPPAEYGVHDAQHRTPYGPIPGPAASSKRRRWLTLDEGCVRRPAGGLVRRLSQGRFRPGRPAGRPAERHPDQRLVQRYALGFPRRSSGQSAVPEIDCDLYSSASFVLTALRDRTGPGCVIQSDEFFNYPGWRPRYKAFNALIESTGVNCRFRSFFRRHQSVCVVIP